MSGGARLLRGLSAAGIAVGSAVVAHIAAGHHGPHWVILVLAMCLSVPACIALVQVRLSRWRLAAAVLFSQGVLHVLFALFPYDYSSSGLSAGQPSQAGHHHHVDHLVVADPAVGSVSSHMVAPDAAMSVAHLSAAVLTYVLLRRSEVLLEALVSLLGLRPALILVLRPLVPIGPKTMTWADTWAAQEFSDLWPGPAPWTLRGPPVVS